MLLINSNEIRWHRDNNSNQQQLSLLKNFKPQQFYLKHIQEKGKQIKGVMFTFQSFSTQYTLFSLVKLGTGRIYKTSLCFLYRFQKILSTSAASRETNPRLRWLSRKPIACLHTEEMVSNSHLVFIYDPNYIVPPSKLIIMHSFLGHHKSQVTFLK